MKKKFISLTKILNIIENEGVDIEIENRRSLDLNTYKTRNHAEILNLWNKADNCLWDVQLLGYNEQFSYNSIYYTNKILGYIKMPNNNDKILLKLTNKGWSKDKFLRDVKRYIYEYNKTNNIKGTLILI